MEAVTRDPRPCAHCGGTLAADDTTCASCGRPYIPDAVAGAHPTEPPPRAADDVTPAGGVMPHDDAVRDGVVAGDGAVPGDRVAPAGADLGVPPPEAGSGALPPVSAGQVSDESRGWAIAAHLSALALVAVGGLPALIGPLVVWLLRRDAGDPFATEHARGALNFNLSMLIYAVVGAIVAFVGVVLTLGLGLIVVIPVVIAAAIGYLVVTVRGAMAAADRRMYRYPLTLDLVT